MIPTDQDQAQQDVNSARETIYRSFEQFPALRESYEAAVLYILCSDSPNVDDMAKHIVSEIFDKGIQ